MSVFRPTMTRTILLIAALAISTPASATGFVDCFSQCVNRLMECLENSADVTGEVCTVELAMCQEHCTAAALAAKPPAREGGAYDKPMLLRPGVDDLGISLGQWVACGEKTLQEAAERGDLPPITEDVELVEDEGRATVIFPDNPETVYFDYDVAEDFVVMSAIRVGDKTTRNPDDFWKISMLYVDACL